MELKIWKRTGRAAGILSVAVACYWSGMLSPSPSWRLFAAFAAVGILESIAGRINGYLKAVS